MQQTPLPAGSSTQNSAAASPSPELLWTFLFSREGKVIYPSPVLTAEGSCFLLRVLSKGLEMWAERNCCYQLGNQLLFVLFFFFLAFVRNGPREICSVILLAQGTYLILGCNRPQGEAWVSCRRDILLAQLGARVLLLEVLRGTPAWSSTEWPYH